MTFLKCLTLTVLTGLLAAASPAAAPPPVAVRVSPNASMAPATVRVTVTVEPDERNRGLMVEADSLNFYSSSEVALEGTGSSRVKRFEFKNLPPGEYEVRATVQRNDGNRQVASTLTIVS